jgi:hypothetical protein
MTRSRKSELGDVTSDEEVFLLAWTGVPEGGRAADSNADFPVCGLLPLTRNR